MARILTEDVLVYGASKTWHDELWKGASLKGYSIVSSWYEFGCRVENLPENKWHALWHHVLLDCQKADMLVIYCGDPKEEQGGAMIEIGQMFGQNKPVYCIGNCVSFMPQPHSDRAFIHCHLWHWTDASTFSAGLREAVAHYKRNYSDRWHLSRQGQNLPSVTVDLPQSAIAKIGEQLKAQLN